MVKIFKNILLTLFIILLGIQGFGNSNIINDGCRGEIAEILLELRMLMKNLNTSYNFLQNIDAYIVPMNDAHQSEYISDYDKRLQFITKFSGSAGTAVITQTKAALWTDFRYHIQAENQINLNCWKLMKQGNQNVLSIQNWIISNLSNNTSNNNTDGKLKTVGVDPFIISSSKYKFYLKELEKGGIKLVSVKMNLIDSIWKNKPKKNETKIIPLDIKFSGKISGEKIIELKEKIQENKAEFLVITSLDEIAWLLNLRASDIPYNPVFFSYIILTLDNLYLCINSERITSEIKNHFKNEKVNYEIKGYDDILNVIQKLVKNTSGKIIISNDVSQAIYEIIPDERRIQIASIAAKMKAIKNKIECKNMKNSHIRDGLALIRYLYWLDTIIDNENVTEISGALKLEEFRSQQQYYKGLSFETISAFGSNAAIVHYAPTYETDVQITRNKIYLVDSGGQYLDGTTDVTRTVHYGKPTDIEKECFTRVLKGFIALAISVFPVKTPFDYFDHVARRYLWQAGLDYGHGTGHGVGAYLNVHEYPPLISSSTSSFGVKDPGALENMFTSNEPGYYRDGLFGIRIEDVVQIVKTNNLTDAFNERGSLTFKTVTLCPIQIKMINLNLLTKEEKDYINTYHQEIRDTIGPLLLKQNLNETFEWLLNETVSI